MAARVTADDVLAILDDSALTAAQIAPFITSANVMINENIGTDTTDLLKEIERWLTAHMISITRERQSIKEEAGSAKVEYAGKFGEGLKSTSYGQMVLSLDTTGIFASLGGKAIYTYAIKSFD